MAGVMNDPGRVALRRAARTAIVMPIVFAIAVVCVDEPSMAIFAAFSSFALLALADFGGPMRTRLIAYLAATLLGGLLVVLATPVSGSPWVGALFMTVVGAVVVFGGVLGGYASAGASAVTLAFVLAVTIPAPASDIPLRLAGWALGGVASALAAILLWPSHESDAVRGKVKEAARAIRGVIGALAESEEPGPVDDDLRTRARVAVASLDQTARDVPSRPIGPTPRLQALAYLVDQLRGLHALADELAAEEADNSTHSSADRDLLRVTTALLDSVASGGEPDLVAFEAVFETHRAGTGDALVVAVEARRSGADLADDLERAFRVRGLAAAAFSIAANWVLVEGATLPDEHWLAPPITPPRDLSTSTRRYVRLARAQLHPDSVWFRSGARAGIGLGLAVLIAGLASLSHAFWVALATLSVLKSNAVGTRHTAAQAFVGTSVGFLLASALSLAIGDDEVALWVALPICVFLAVYTPTAVRFVVGQAMFTVLVVVLFNLIEPVGWRVAEARVEDIAVGAATAFVVGVLLWPRGASTALRSSLADLFDASAAYLARSIDGVLDRGSSPAPGSELALAAHAAGLQVSDAFATFLDERGPKHVPAAAWTSLITVGESLPYAGDALVTITEGRGPVRGFPQQVNRIEAVSVRVIESIGEVAMAIAEHREVPSETLDGGRRVELTAIAGESLALLSPDDDAEQVEDALRIAWTVDRIAATDGLLCGVSEPLRQSVIEHRPWWR